MSLFQPAEWLFTEKALELVTANPFDPDWAEKGSALLGLPFRKAAKPIAWYPGAELWGPHSVYSEDLHERITKLGKQLCLRVKEGASPTEKEWNRYELLSIYCLYCQCGEAIDRFIDSAVRRHEKSLGEGRRPSEEEPLVKKMWDGFQGEYETLFEFKHFHFPTKYTREHLFACFFVFRRAFYHIFFNIVGTSKPIAELRSIVWESIVTHDLLAWMQGLHRRMKDIPTLITGESGTGKERVAEAIGRSLYIPFNSKKKAFEIDFVKGFNPVSLSALPPLLIEAELFGHVKGAFAGATSSRVGRLEECPENGAVFLDEIGELTPEIQVKLLRVLQTRTFQPVGSNEDRLFRGKVISATNRDLAVETETGRFRNDFYYRLCADQITTPSLRSQLKDRPQDLPLMLERSCRAVVGDQQAADLAPRIVAWLKQNLPGYTWPGNVRELEQCVRSHTIRKTYSPIASRLPEPEGTAPQSVPDMLAGACKTLAEAVLQENTTYDEIERRLFSLVCNGTPSMAAAARRLGRDSRTVQARLKAGHASAAG
jgi:DNA-binding NtrC family response regulator